jgi:GT2 family glycosyltransferase
MFQKLLFHLILIPRYFFNRLTKTRFSPREDIYIPCSGQEKSTPRKTTIVIPSKDNPTELALCIASIEKNTKLDDCEIIIVDNGSLEEQTQRLLEELTCRGYRVLKYPQKFNFSAICNLAAAEAKGELLVFLNDDTQATNSEWLPSMQNHAFRPEIGAVGALLTYPSGKTQHAGIVFGKRGLAGHLLAVPKPTNISHMSQTCYKTSGVTFAAVAIEKRKYFLINGLDESFPVGLNDVDFCLRLKQMNLHSVVCVNSRFLHNESSTRRKMSLVSKLLQHYVDISRFVRLHGFPDEEYFA